LPFRRARARQGRVDARGPCPSKNRPQRRQPQYQSDGAPTPGLGGSACRLIWVLRCISGPKAQPPTPPATLTSSASGKTSASGAASERPFSRFVITSLPFPTRPHARVRVVGCGSIDAVHCPDLGVGAPTRRV